MAHGVEASLMGGGHDLIGQHLAGRLEGEPTDAGADRREGMLDSFSSAASPRLRRVAPRTLSAVAARSGSIPAAWMT